VATVLGGGVQRSGDRVRINVQLIDAETDEHLWAETYEEDLTAENVFAIQTDIAGRIASALKAQLTPGEQERIATRPTENLEAYEQYLAARGYATHLREELERVKVRMYEEAVDLDPAFALAHARLSIRYTWLYYGYGHNEEDLSKAKVHADRALDLDPDLADAHIALGRFFYQGFLDYERALEHLAVARELRPQDYYVHFWLMAIQRRMGDWDAALASSKKAIELNPRSVGAAEELPVIHVWMRHYERAMSLFDRAIALDPARIYSYFWKSWAHLNTEGGVKNASQDWEPLLRIRGRADAWTNPGEESYRPRSRLFRGRARLRILHEDYKDYLRQYSLEMFSGDTLNYFLSRALSFRLTGEIESARAYFDSARVILEKRGAETEWESVSSPQPRADHHASLGVIYGGLGRADDAVREGKLAIEALPVSRDAMMGPFYVATLAEIYVMVGEYDAATDQLEQVLSLTCPISPPLLRADPIWEPLRDNPRFQALTEKYD
jgi:serine/threonine-protein kinase